MITIQEQEDFIHMIYDVFGVGVSVSSLEFKIEHLVDKYGKDNIKEILNSKMKDEKYSDNLVYPLTKVLYIDTNIYINKDRFFEKKLHVLKIFENYGVDFSIIDQRLNIKYIDIDKYSMSFLNSRINGNDIDVNIIELLLGKKLIDNKIFEFLSRFIKPTINITI